MPAVDNRTRPPRPREGGFTLAEAVVSVVIVSVLLVAALNTLGASRLGQYKTCQLTQAQFLAQELLAEIVRQEYWDPDGGACFGVESDEDAACRSDFDDVDDYHGWAESPPQEKDGSVLPDLAGWERRVVVEWVNPLDAGSPVGWDAGAKRITVSVRDNEAKVASAVAVRTCGLPTED